MTPAAGGVEMNGRKPTLAEKKLLKARNLNPDNWLIVKAPVGELHLAHRYAKSKRVLRGRLLREPDADVS